MREIDAVATPLTVLIVDDCEADALLDARALNRGGYDPWCWRVDTPEALAEALDRRAWDVVLCNGIMPRLPMSGSLKMVHSWAPLTPVILQSGHRAEDLDDALATGRVCDVLGKDHLQDLPALMGHILHR